MDLKKLYLRHKDIILYGTFGVLTTAVNIAAYWIMAHPVGFTTMGSTVIAWLAAVTFAYMTNRKWVFHSEVHNGTEIVKEAVSFFSCRLITGLADWGCMFVCVDVFRWNDVAVKGMSNVLVVILNYIASKTVIFRYRKTD